MAALTGVLVLVLLVNVVFVMTIGKSCEWCTKMSGEANKCKTVSCLRNWLNLLITSIAGSTWANNVYAIPLPRCTWALDRSLCGCCSALRILCSQRIHRYNVSDASCMCVCCLLFVILWEVIILLLQPFFAVLSLLDETFVELCMGEGNRIY